MRVLSRLAEAMGGEVVHDESGARLVPPQSWDRHLLQERLKHRPVSRSGHGHGAAQAAERQGSEHRDAAPVAGRGAIGALAARLPRIKPRQLGADPGLVEKDQILGRDALDGFGKGGAFGGNVRARLLARPEGLFFTRQAQALEDDRERRPADLY